jgi:hypothetical protein
MEKIQLLETTVQGLNNQLTASATEKNEIETMTITITNLNALINSIPFKTLQVVWTPYTLMIVVVVVAMGVWIAIRWYHACVCYY